MMAFNDQSSDSSSLSDFFTKEYEGLFRYATHLANNNVDIAADAVSESFSKIISQYDKYRNFPEQRLFSYMLTMIRNTIIDEQNLHKRQVATPLIDLIPDDDVDLLEPYIQALDEELLNYCISQLEPHRRQIIKMVYFDDMPLEQVGEALNMTPESARVTLWRIRRKLKELYIEQEARWCSDGSKTKAGK